MKRNAELFNKIADRIESDPVAYNQDVWLAIDRHTTDCGTVACIAGHAAHIEGWRPGQGYLVEKDGNPSSLETSEVARTALGLTEDEADVLFCADWLPNDSFYLDSHLDVTRQVVKALRALANGATIEEVTDDA